MFLNKNILCVIPARGGSKGIKEKNIYPVMGQPLIKYTLDFVSELEFIDRVFVSTDSKKISEYVSSQGFDIPFLRSRELAGDFISDFEVLQEALIKIEEIDRIKYDFVIMLQPTSPLRKKEHIIKCLELIAKKDFDSVWTISRVPIKYHPLKQLNIRETRLKHYSKRGKNIIARQQLDHTYIRNGVCYIFKRDIFLKNKKMQYNLIGFHVIDEDTVNIDQHADILEFEKILKNY